MLNMIFRADLDNRPSLDDIKKHEFFRSIDFDELASGQIEAPWVPDDRVRTLGQRDSQTGVLKVKKGALGDDSQTDVLDFDERHFQKFLRTHEKQNEGDENVHDVGQSPKRRRQNPLGDFKFKRIDKLF